MSDHTTAPEAVRLEEGERESPSRELARVGSRLARLDNRLTRLDARLDRLFPEDRPDLVAGELVCDVTRERVWAAAFAHHLLAYSAEGAWGFADTTAGMYDSERARREKLSTSDESTAGDAS